MEQTQPWWRVTGVHFPTAYRQPPAAINLHG